MKTMKNSFFIIIVLFAAVYPDASMASKGTAVVESIRLKGRNQVLISLNQKQAYKVFRFDDKTVMIALKNTRIADSIPKQLTGTSTIPSIVPENLPGKSASVEISVNRQPDDATAFWKGNTLVVTIRETSEKPKHKKRPQLMAKPARKTKKTPPSVQKKADTMENRLPAKDAKPAVKKLPNGLKGNIDDLPTVLKKDKCRETPAIRQALDYCQKNAFRDAYQTLNNVIENNPSHECFEPLLYLRAYASHKEVEFPDEAKLLETAMFFQDAISYYPESPYLPFGMAAQGTIYRMLNNYSEAKGYFNIVLQKYETYTGIPGVLYELGMIHVKTATYRKAVVRLEQIVNEYPDVSFIADVRRELGKAYFNINNFSKSLEQMQWLVNNRPKMVYNDPSLLLYIGNSYYHTGEHLKARTVLNRAYNLYPEVENNHIILTRIADIYADEGNHEKAKDIYKLVTDKFPGTDGFVISTMRLTEYVTEPENRKDLYMMVINDYPEHPMASLAQLRLAELHYKMKDYDKSIETINRLLEENPRALVSEANFLKQKSFEAVFKKLFEADNYPDILLRFENDKTSFKRFENPELFFYVGKAYYMGHLFENAVENLEKAVTIYPDDKKSAELLYLLGAAFFEIGQGKDAEKILKRYLREYPDQDHASSALLKIGLAQINDKKYKHAAKSLNDAMTLSTSDEEKADILLAGALIYDEHKQFSKTADAIARAINLLSASADANPADISDAYKQLGHTFLKQNKFDKSADAFAMALKFQENDRDAFDLKYLLGISYQKGLATGKAKDTFSEVVEGGDPFWAKLAKEKLREIKLSS